FDKHANLKYKYGNRKFWARGYYVSTVGLNEKTVAKYIREQEKNHIALTALKEINIQLSFWTADSI
ncbi:transposase, partial [Streptococcus dentapri]